jgi:uncharacterized membrane protein
MDVQRSSRRRLAALGVLVLASVFAVSLVALRYALSGSLHYSNLVWNLVLAWVPLMFALIAYDRFRRGARGIQLLLPLALWLIFLPNAPYLVTDLKILREVRNMPIWFDIGLVTSFAWVGLLLGFISVYLVQDIARRAAGPVVGWATVVAAFGLSGIGIYLGRYLRLNSWDVFVRPSGILHDVASQLVTPRLVGMSLLMAAFLTVAYAMLYTVLEAAVDDRRERPQL